LCPCDIKQKVFDYLLTSRSLSGVIFDPRLPQSFHSPKHFCHDNFALHGLSNLRVSFVALVYCTHSHSTQQRNPAMTFNDVNQRNFFAGAALLYGSVFLSLFFSKLSAIFLLMPLACCGFSLMVLGTRAMKGRSVSNVRQMVCYNVPFYLLCILPTLLTLFTWQITVTSVLWHLLYFVLCTAGHAAPYLAANKPTGRPLLRVVVLD